jgi:hypothetical protein
MGGSNNRSVPEPGVADFQTGRFQSPGSACDDGFRVTVIFTTRPGTKAALRIAGHLAKGLGARVGLVVAYEVPVHLPLNKPPVPVEFLERHQIRLVSESAVRADEVNIEIFLCHDQRECLKRILRPGSLVVVGGRRCRWLSKERRLEQWLARLGHQVVFAEVEPRNRPGIIGRLRDSALLSRMRGCFKHRERDFVPNAKDPKKRSAL